MFKTSERNMSKVENNVKRDEVLGTWRNGFPNTSCPNLPHCHRYNEHLAIKSPVWRVSHTSHSPPLTSFADGLHVSAHNSSYSAPFQDRKHVTPHDHHSTKLLLDPESSDFHIGKSIIDNQVVDLDLSRDFYRMNIIDGRGNGNKTKAPEADSYGFRFDAFSSFDINIPGVTETRSSYEDFCNEVPAPNYECISSSTWGVSPSLVADMKWNNHTLEKGHTSSLAHGQSSALSLCSGWNMNQTYHQLEHSKKQGSSSYDGEVQPQKPSIITPYLCDGLTSSQLCGVDYDGSRSVENPLRFSQIMQPKLASHQDILETRGIANFELPEFLPSKRAGGDPVAFRCDNSFIIQGRDINYCTDKGYNSLRGTKKNSLNENAFATVGEEVSKHNSYTPGSQICANKGSLVGDFPLPSLLSFCSLAECQGYICFLAKDQNGCRFLQRMVDKGNSKDMHIVFEGIIDNVVELMMDPFGNYLVQKLLDVCREEEKLQIVSMVTKEPGQLVRISLNTHGTRVIQKLIETLNSRKQISLVKSALQAGFLDLVKDLNGNHVIQRCLQCLSCQDNEFIFYAAAKFCVDIATHRHGCCVLQRCIDHSIGKYRDKLVAEICRHGLHLAQDPFGNYVVQYIIEMEIPTASAKLVSQFKGNYVNLSTQKFSSHVVEKCLKHVGESRSRIVRELLSSPHFEQLLQDPYANYVIQSALAVTKGSLHTSLVEAVRPYKILRTSPYCKRIFSGNLLKK
ncbi:uncharacterized protein LOC129300763 [Prosopis cineraria]|uniref:uncharacterized protein LOC129297951 n=1 Tax=Prosopis cineraria TaxID=364024 RepID=UPI0024107AC6|nr:uncharacterized protein LOC129297951 [Prosopis cineraria]XP_054795328.1 uncharacterized protein LOC129300763 [Prosopis cineraria]